MANIKQYTLVKLSEHGYKMYRVEQQGFFDKRDDIFVYLGEISNMRGHVVVAGHVSGKIYSGYHDDNFVELTEDEV